MQQGQFYGNDNFSGNDHFTTSEPSPSTVCSSEEKSLNYPEENWPDFNHSNTRLDNYFLNFTSKL